MTSIIGGFSMVKINSGQSKVDRITFYSSKVGAAAIQLPNGKIKVEYQQKNITVFQVLVVLGLFSVISLFKSFLIIPYINSNTSMVYIYLIPAAIYSLLVFTSIKEVRKKGQENLLKNHGAEHMVYKAYKELKRMPTISEVKKFSRISSQCGINIYSAFITAQLMGFLVYRYLGYVIPEALLVIIPILMASSFPFNVLGNIAQLLTTSKPDDANISLALTAISALERKVLLGEIVDSSFDGFSKH